MRTVEIFVAGCILVVVAVFAFGIITNPNEPAAALTHARDTIPEDSLVALSHSRDTLPQDSSALIIRDTTRVNTDTIDGVD